MSVTTSVAVATSILDNYFPSNALDYVNDDIWYHSVRDGNPQEWGVDLIKTVTINSYQIKAGTGCNWISKWNFCVSMNNISWNCVDSPAQGYPEDKTFQLNSPAKARFVKIEGSSPLCSSAKTSFAFKHIKFFGLISPARVYVNTCIRKKIIDTNLMKVILMMVYS